MIYPSPPYTRPERLQPEQSNEKREQFCECVYARQRPSVLITRHVMMSRERLLPCPGMLYQKYRRFEECLSPL